MFPKNQLDPQEDTETVTHIVNYLTGEPAPKTNSIRKRILKPVMKIGKTQVVGSPKNQLDPQEDTETFDPCRDLVQIADPKNQLDPQEDTETYRAAA